MTTQPTHDRQDAETQSVSLEGLTLQVADVERSLEFYSKLPGARVAVHRPGFFALLYFGRTRLGLLSKRVGATHLEFATANPDALYQQLKEAGFPVAEPPSQKGWGDYNFFLQDPDGYTLEFETPERGNADLAGQEES